MLVFECTFSNSFPAVKKHQKMSGFRGAFMASFARRSLLAALLAVAVGVYLLPSPIDPKPHRWVHTFLSSADTQMKGFSCSVSLKGPPPTLEGPLATNTLLQKGRRLFTGTLHGPESFTADEDGESPTTCLNWIENFCLSNTVKLPLAGLETLHLAF